MLNKAICFSLLNNKNVNLSRKKEAESSPASLNKGI
jgi:hypothetical protein